MGGDDKEQENQIKCHEDHTGKITLCVGDTGDVEGWV